MEMVSLDFVNSVFRDFRGRWERDDLRQPEWLARFLEKWHFYIVQPVDETVMKELVDLRELLVRIVGKLNTPQGVDAQDLIELNTHLSKTVFHYQVELVDRELHVASQPVRKDWNWVQNEIIADFLALVADYDALRVKICNNPHCRWIFYDETKSRTRRYCSIDKCANLMKVRRFRARQKERI
ncbi:MAG TPA: CGNR zinc finger domain-containing protein [Ktedonobacteraceae bacterium]